MDSSSSSSSSSLEFVEDDGRKEGRWRSNAGMGLGVLEEGIVKEMVFVAADGAEDGACLPARFVFTMIENPCTLFRECRWNDRRNRTIYLFARVVMVMILICVMILCHILEQEINAV